MCFLQWGVAGVFCRHGGVCCCCCCCCCVRCLFKIECFGKSGVCGSAGLGVWGSARGSDLLVWPHSVLCVWFLKPRARLCCCHCGGCRLTLATLSRSCRAISSIWGSEKPQMGKKSASVELQTSIYHKGKESPLYLCILQFEILILGKLHSPLSICPLFRNDKLLLNCLQFIFFR